MFRCAPRHCTCWQSLDILCMLHGSHKPPVTCSNWSPPLLTGYLHKPSSLTQSFPRSYLGSSNWSRSFIRYLCQHPQRSTLSGSHTRKTRNMQHAQHMWYSCNWTPPARLRCTRTLKWATAASRTFRIAASQAQYCSISDRISLTECRDWQLSRHCATG